MRKTELKSRSISF